MRKGHIITVRGIYSEMDNESARVLKTLVEKVGQSEGQNPKKN